MKLNKREIAVIEALAYMIEQTSHLVPLQQGVDHANTWLYQNNHPRRFKAISQGRDIMTIAAPTEE